MTDGKRHRFVFRGDWLLVDLCVDFSQADINRPYNTIRADWVGMFGARSESLALDLVWNNYNLCRSDGYISCWYLVLAEAKMTILLRPVVAATAVQWIVDEFLPMAAAIICVRVDGTKLW